MYLPLRTLAIAGLTALALPSVIAQGTSSGASQTTPVSGTNTNSNSVSSTNSNAAQSATVTFTDVSTVVPVLATQSISRTIASVQTLSSAATVIRVSYTLTPSTTSASATSAAASATSTPFPHLDTRIDPTFGVLGALLILTGLPTAFWGHKNRWSSFFLIGFYTLALTTVVLILKFGVLDAINPPSKAVRGMFLLASAVAGVMGGGLSIFFWKHTRYFIGAWGGFALALWIQCFREGGLIRQIAYRWIFYVGCAVVGFILCTIPKIHYNVLLVSTALVGASATILGVDCYTTAGLKEFYVWNLGFMRLFPVFYNIGMPYPLYQAMQIELGLIAAVALMGGAVQFRMLGLLKKRLLEINEEQRKRDEDAEIAAAERLGAFDDQLEEWEKRHGNLVGKDLESSGALTPTVTANDGRPSSQFSLLNGPKSAGLATTPGARSGDYFAVPLQSPKAAVIATPEPTANGISGRPQSIGALPVLDLGTDDLAGGAGGVKRDSIARMEDIVKPTEDTPAARRREELRAEIEALKKNISQLKTETSGAASRPASILLLDTDLTRNRTVSFDALAASGSRSAPLEPPPESEWDKYVRERKLFTPPSGVTPPIPSGTINGRPMTVMLPDAVADAVEMRRRRESMLEMGKLEEAVVAAAIPSRRRSRTMSNGTRLDLSGGSSSDGQQGRDHPTHPAHTRQRSHDRPTILPPRKSMSPGPRLVDSGRPRVKTYEEMQERHREKMRALQEPLRRAEEELAELEKAKSRWERSVQVEKQVMERREAERRAAYERKVAEESGKTGKGGVGNRISKLFGTEKSQHQPAPAPAPESESTEEEKTRPPREKPGHSIRDSAAAKVAAWQAYQEQSGHETGRPSGDRRVSGDGHRRHHSRQSSGAFKPAHARQSSGRMQDHMAPN